MRTSFRARFGALAIAAAVAATGGILAAAPAHAAGTDAQITLANSTFIAGDWGTGLEVSGTGFTPDSNVTISVVENVDRTLLGQTVIAAGADGAFTTSFTPTVALTVANPDQAVVVGAQSDAGDSANIQILDIRAPKGISANTRSITAEDLADLDAGIDLVASGYDPDEEVVISGTLNGLSPDPLTVTADRTGTIRVSHLHLTAGAHPGELVLLAKGTHSNVENRITITVTGASAGGSGGAGIGSGAPVAAAPAAKLPVVSG